jgi:hypothetical protein
MKLRWFMLLHSRRAGSYSTAYTQFDTIRKLRSAFSNHCRASAKSNRTSLALGNQKGKYQWFATDLCSSFWFYRFLEGACHQMGQDWWPNKAIPIELLLILLESTELFKKPLHLALRIDGWCFTLTLPSATRYHFVDQKDSF